MEKRTAAATKLLILLLQLQVGMIDFGSSQVHYDTFCVVQFSKNKLRNSFMTDLCGHSNMATAIERFKTGKNDNTLIPLEFSVVNRNGHVPYCLCEFDMAKKEQAGENTCCHLPSVACCVF